MVNRNSSPDAFIDRGFPDSKSFCTQFLYSPEFSLYALKSLAVKDKSLPKYELASRLAELIENETLRGEEVMRSFVKQPRKFLSFKLGSYKKLPELRSANNLLTECCDDGWYGPIINPSKNIVWYIRTKKIPFYERGVYQSNATSENGGKRQVSSTASYSIRWTVIAEVAPHYIALSWNNFSYNIQDRDSSTQFQYWNFIPSFFDEISEKLNAHWEYPLLDDLVLQKIWDKYLLDHYYIWQHLRIRADKKGVALNAHSTGKYDRKTMRGLQALSHQLALTALDSLDVGATPENINNVESSLLRTLIKEWGTKSYEFSLDKVDEDSKYKNQGIFRAHFYFANGVSSSPQDSFRHLNCFINNYGGSSQALQFLLSELGY
jgi:hypothetical protein